jgi:hypothetical protein
MKQTLHLSASVENPQMLESIVEQLATRRYHRYYVETLVPKAWQAMESSSVESYVSGTVDISGEDLIPVHLPFTSSFLFSCTKEKHHPYELRWCVSLS